MSVSVDGQFGVCTALCQTGVRRITHTVGSPFRRLLLGLFRLGFFDVSGAPGGTLQSSNRGLLTPTLEGGNVGFRVAAVPEPSVLWMAVAGAIGLLMRRKR